MKNLPTYFLKTISCLLVLAAAGCSDNSTKPVALKKLAASKMNDSLRVDGAHYVGSESCRECHENFYQLWAPSHHGLAMQPWSKDLANKLPKQKEAIEAEGKMYKATITNKRGWITDNEGTEYDIAYSLGGKNYYNFLTLMEDGRLQVLPIFYDVAKDAWRNTTLSMLRHFDDGRTDTAVSWRDSMLTFNAECFRCHVSQSESNYDPETDTYATTWKEPGISCESCHGPSSEHVRVCQEAPEGTTPKDMKLIGWWEMNREQRDSNCAGCHTKGAAISKGFETGDRYWDHYDLTTFENADYFADGRDFGENYTMGSWYLSKCVTQGELACTHCHTSSGRNKHKDAPNNACLPCHQERVEKPETHIKHSKKADLKCIACHMPMNPFGGMNQSDHSMRPPMPQLSEAVGSRNACTMCHKEKGNDWALEQINKWHPNFEKNRAFEVERALLVQALRDGDYEQLPAAHAFISDPKSDPLFVATLIRLLPPSLDPAQHAIQRTLVETSDHPLVRSTAATGLDADRMPEDRPTLFKALSDDYRLVRIRAAERLIALTDDQVPAEHKAALDTAKKEMWESVNLRLDNWGSHFNAGNILVRQNRLAEAGEKFDRAHELRDDIPQPLINSAMAYARLGQLDDAKNRLLKATKLPEPSAGAHFNLGLLDAEQGNTAESEAHFREALKIDPRQAQAAYNLGIMLCNRGQMLEGLKWAKLAVDENPYDPRNLSTYAFYLQKFGALDDAAELLLSGIESHPAHSDNYFLLGSIYERQKKFLDAIKVYVKAAENPALSMQMRQTAMQAKARAQQQLSALLK